MATTSHGQPILAAVPPPPINLKTPYATILNSKAKDKDTTIYETFDVPIKPPKNINGRHTISWSKKEIQQSILQTNLQYAIMGKFKYGTPDIHELRKVIPSQCGIKGECIIGLLETKVILIRCIDREDYINLLSTTGFWLTLKNESIHMRTMKWDIWQDSKKEPPIAMAWISLPNLPPNFFADDFVKSIALAVGKPMQLDLATKTNSRPSCARVKVEVNLLSDLPDGVEVGEHDENENVISSKWIKIRYDYLPKYCKTCCLQGHNEQECYSLHPDLYPRKNMDNKQKNVVVIIQNNSENKEENFVVNNENNSIQNTNSNTTATTSEPNNIFSNGRLVFNEQSREEWQQGRKKKHGASQSAEQTVQVWKTNSSKEDKGHNLKVSNVNTFTVLNNEDDEQIQEMDNAGGETHLLQASDNGMHDNNENFVGTMSTERANQGIKSPKEEKDSQHELESLENIVVKDHVDSGYKHAQNRRAHAGNFCKSIQNSGHAIGDHLKKRMDTKALGPVPLHTKTNNAPNIVSAQNVNGLQLCKVGPCVNRVNETTKNKSISIAAPSTNPRNILAKDDPKVIAQIRANAKASVDNVVVAMTQVNHDCLEKKTAYTVGPQNSNSPSHSSNALIPTEELELMFKVQRLMKLYDTDLVTLDMAKKLTKQEHHIFLKIMRDSGYLCTSVAKETETRNSTKGETTTTAKASAPSKKLQI